MVPAVSVPLILIVGLVPAPVLAAMDGAEPPDMICPVIARSFTVIFIFVESAVKKAVPLAF